MRRIRISKMNSNQKNTNSQGNAGDQNARKTTKHRELEKTLTFEQ
jgi:hypothetical protein